MKKFDYDDILQTLNDKGEWCHEESKIQKDIVLNLYRQIHLTRVFDKKAIHLQRTGQLGTFPSSYGQEAVFVGAGMAMDENDVFCPYYRDHGALFTRKVDPSEIFSYWGGSEWGSHFKHNKHDLPINVPIASQCTHAAGIAYAMKLQNKKQAVVCTLGDGATSKGDFYEALNFCAIYDLAVIFLVNNNQYAISVPLNKQTKETNLAKKGLACGVRGIRVDGHDPVAIYSYFDECLQQCRNGQGPLIFEALTHRLCDHTTADDASRYVSKSYIQEGESLDSLKRLAICLESYFSISEKEIEEIEQENKAVINSAVKEYLAMPKPKLDEIFDFMFATPTHDLQMQKQQLYKDMEHD